MSIISALQQQLGDLDAWLIPHEDDYLGEYLPAANERLAFVTGFTGSAGQALVTRNGLHVWVDGRYTVQVRTQVPTGTQVHHLVEEPLADFLATQADGFRLGLDSGCVSARQLAHWQQAAPHVTFVDRDNLVDALWDNRPALPQGHGFVLPEVLTGQSCVDKRQAVAARFAAKADWALLTQADSVAWLTNLRGSDVPRLPVMLMRALLGADGQLKLFCDPERLPADANLGDAVQILEHSQLDSELAALSGQRVWLDEALTPARFSQQLTQSGATVVPGQEPTLVLKAAKNTAELDGMAEAHLRDGAAVCEFLYWLDALCSSGQRRDEAELAQQLESYRLAQADYLEPSFDTISAAGANAALPHYNFRNGEPAMLPEQGLYLVDSGGQYRFGTTDVTRTVAIGEPTDEQRRLFTLVLKGHIALAKAKFVKGTTGHQLDVLARAPLWAEGYDFDHGTGHGVGHCLSVHEGPQGISKRANSQPLLPGMVLSNEPGYYREGAFGIRIENLVVVRERDAEGDRSVYGFDNLTFIPMDRRLLDLSLLDDGERQWWNQYHQQVLAHIGPRVDDNTGEWLREVCAPL
ncbi:M24 family metallopeptidase [Gallaecimonas sp. GXIMD1310]|uniref:M24B family metallopeptidase n=1 Tax=Gallaecimonas sp. GXIMD1310 TaxID=3131926 RepID=UPI0032461EA9